MKSNKIFNIFLLIILLVGVLIRFDLNDRPIQFNEGTYAYIADKMLNEDMRYLDIYDSKPPGIYYLFMFFMKIFGNETTSFHLVSAVSDVIIIFLIFIISSKLFNRSVALLSSTIYSILYIPFTVSKGGFLEPSMMAFSLLSIYFYLKTFDKDNFVYPILSGIFLAVSFNIKQPAIILFLTYFLYLGFMFIKNKISFSKAIRLFLLITAGFLIIFLPILSIIIYSGKFGKYFLSVYYSSFAYGPTLYSKISFLILTFRHTMYIFSLTALISLFYPLTKKLKLTTIFLYFWVIPIIIFYLLTSDFHPHYLIQILPVMTIFVGYFLSRMNIFVKTLIFLSILVMSSIFISSEINYYHNYSKEYFIEDFFAKMKYPNTLRAMYRMGYSTDQIKVADFIKSNTGPLDRIITPVPTYSYLTNMTSNYKFIWINPMVSRIRDTSDFSKYASQSKYLIYEIWQGEQEHISINFIDCIKENWKFIESVSTWYILVYENIDPNTCKNVW